MCFLSFTFVKLEREWRKKDHQQFAGPVHLALHLKLHLHPWPILLAHPYAVGELRGRPPDQGDAVSGRVILAIAA